MFGTTEDVDFRRNLEICKKKKKERGMQSDFYSIRFCYLRVSCVMSCVF